MSFFSVGISKINFSKVKTCLAVRTNLDTTVSFVLLVNVEHLYVNHTYFLTIILIGTTNV